MPKRGRRWYGVRYGRGGYAILGRRCLVRTFGSEAERDEWVAAQAPRHSILFDGECVAVSATTYVTEWPRGQTIHISEAIPGL